MHLSRDEEQPFLGHEISQGRGHSEATAAQVDEQVQQILQERFQCTRACPKKNREALDSPVKTLVEHEIMLQGKMERIIGLQPWVRSLRSSLASLLR